MERDVLKSRFREKLDLFCFFHLGADVQTRVEEVPDRLRVSLRHHRIEPLEFAVSRSRLKDLLEAPQELEVFLLEQITPHRR